jgi:hypothetical protein
VSLRGRGEQVTNAKGVFSHSLAEYALLAAGYFAKDLPRWLANKATRRPNPPLPPPRPAPPRPGRCWAARACGRARGRARFRTWDRFAVGELRGSTLGILGYGDIGRATAHVHPPLPSRAHAGLSAAALSLPPSLSLPPLPSLPPSLPPSLSPSLSSPPSHERPAGGGAAGKGVRHAGRCVAAAPGALGRRSSRRRDAQRRWLKWQRRAPAPLRRRRLRPCPAPPRLAPPRPSRGVASLASRAPSPASPGRPRRT